MEVTEVTEAMEVTEATEVDLGTEEALDIAVPTLEARPAPFHKQLDSTRDFQNKVREIVVVFLYPIVFLSPS